MSMTYTGDLNLRCFWYPAAIHPVQRYVDGLLSLRAARPEQLVFAVIAGVPVHIIDDQGANFEEILESPQMQERIDKSFTPRLVPSCNVPGRGIAFPPRRMVDVASRIDARGGVGIVQSICQSDLTPAVNVLIERLADGFREPHFCVALPPTVDGLVDCWVEVGGIRAPQLATFDGVPEAGEGWYHERASSACGGRDRVSFTEGALPPSVEIALYCPGAASGDP